tara:strand:- start:147 stop:1574 length:1428 start_codon:yes stop_codon:yes gene_type:complete
VTRAKNISKIITDADITGTLDVTGVVTANAGVVVDNITIDGTTVALSSGDLTIDVAGDIILDADTRNIKLQDGGSDWGRFTRDTTTAPSSFVIDTVSSDVDMKFKGNDGGSVITALTLDMSDAGSAYFNNNVYIPQYLTHTGNTDTHLEFNTDTIDLYAGNMRGVTVYPSTVVINEGGADVDFRVESDTQTHALFVQGSDGKVGIGIGSPTSLLHVSGDAKANRIIGNALMESSSGFASDTFSVVGGTTSNQDSKHGGVFFSKHADSNSLLVGQHDTAFQSLVVKGSGDVLFQKTSATTAGAGTFFNVPSAPSTMPVYLRFCKTYSGVREGISFAHNNSQVGGILFDNSSTTFSTSSDYRLKENVVTDWDATTRLKQLKPSRFNFKADADKTVDGFLAHEVSSIVPEAITGTKDELQVWEDGEKLPEGVSVGDNKLDDKDNTIPKYQSIDQSKIVPLLVKTIQELEARITALESA